MQRTKSFISAVLGNFVEYYDYALFGLLASTLSQVYFSSTDPTIGLLKAFGVFALGSIAKPVGAFIFSRIGDRSGRRLALKWNMIGMAIPTTLIGILPSYEAWGMWTPLFLILLRAMQGIFVGGEADGVRIYVMENVGKKRYCFSNGLTGLSSYLGIYVASAMVSIFVAPTLPLWSWRLLFIMGGVFGLIIFVVRRSLHETTDFIIEAQKKASHRSFKKVMRHNQRSLWATILITGSGGGIYHFLIIFMNAYLSKILQILSKDTAAEYTSYALLLYTITAPIGGFVADYLPKMRTLAVGKGLIFLMAFWFAYEVATMQFNLGIFLGLATLMGLFATPGYAILMERIRIRERYRILAMGHAIGSMLFSGTAPVIATYLWEASSLSWAPLAYFMLLILLGLLGIAILWEHKEKAK